MLRNSFLLFVFLFPLIAFSQHDLQGQVVDENNDPLVGATLIIQGTNIAAITDLSGNFLLENIEAGTHNLECNYLGYRNLIQKISLPGDASIKLEMEEKDIISLPDINVKATWASEKTPIAYNNVDKEEIEKINLGQDLPFLLRNTPSLVATSDAGAGVGYTGLRIRGSDATRINVTVNGIPINDSESQGVFWVNMPDFAGSTESIQIQRGVGTSTNGSGAFGATVNLQTNTLKAKPYAEISNSFGSFNTHRHSLKVGTGKLKNNIAIDARASLIQSDGYVDRARADLKSAYFSAGYYGNKTVVKAIAFTGREETYQSWYGTPEAAAEEDLAGINAFADRNFLSDSERTRLINSGRTYNFYQYENEVDNYGQDHYQLHWSQFINNQMSFNAALHYTKGAGYFEQFRADDDFETYNLDPLYFGSDTITSGDFIRRRWLDNDFFGYTTSLKYNKNKLALTLGHAYNKYIGDHFGEVIWAEFASNTSIRDRYYDNRGEKGDLNFYLKGEYGIGETWNLFGDLQFRKVDYSALGVDSDNRDLDVAVDYNFFNPKLGISKNLENNQRVFISAAVANREPSRGDLIDAPVLADVKPEQLLDLELGYVASWQNIALEVNLYRMMYKDQLVLTGALNDVGSSIRINVPDSYRQGIEMQLGWEPIKQWNWNISATFSENKIKSFTEIIYDYTTDFDIIENEFEQTDISFSPSVIAGSEITFQPVKTLGITWMAKYVGRQFLDNTSNENRALDPYFVNDLRFSWQPTLRSYKGLSLNFTLNNFLNEMYSSNGYTYSYVVGDLITENFLYPQAGINFLGGLTLKF